MTRNSFTPCPAHRSSRDQFGNSGQTTSGYDRGGDEDFSGLRDYRLGDPPKHVAWKALARTGEMLVTEYRSGDQDIVWIDWADFPAAGVEARLAGLTRKVLDIRACRSSLRPAPAGLRIVAGRRTAHRHEMPQGAGAVQTECRGA